MCQSDEEAEEKEREYRKCKPRYVHDMESQEIRACTPQWSESARKMQMIPAQETQRAPEECEDEAAPRDYSEDPDRNERGWNSADAGVEIDVPEKGRVDAGGLKKSPLTGKGIGSGAKEKRISAAENLFADRKRPLPRGAHFELDDLKRGRQVV